MRPQYVGTGGSMANACQNCLGCCICLTCPVCAGCFACAPGVALGAVIVTGVTAVALYFSVVNSILMVDRDGGVLDE